MIIRMRYDTQEGGHIRVRVFTGPDYSNCGFSGTLTIRLEDWPAFCGQMSAAGCLIAREGLVSMDDVRKADNAP